MVLSWLRPITAQARVRSQLIQCKICGGQTGTETGFSPSTSVFPCQDHSTNAPYSSSSTRCSYQKDEGTKLPSICKKGKTLSITGEHGTQKYFHFLVFESLMCSYFYWTVFICCCCPSHALETAWWRFFLKFPCGPYQLTFVQLSKEITSPWRHAHFLLSQTLIVTKGSPMGSSEISVPL
jgi:hypothetical protein